MTRIACRQILLPEGWASDRTLDIGADGRIKAIVEGIDQGAYQVDTLIHAPLNLHSHSFQRAMAGLTEKRNATQSDSFWTWRKLMYQFLDQLSPDAIEAIAAQVFMEMLEAGYAAVAEFHYLHHAIGGIPYENRAELSLRIIRAAETAGIGLTLLPVLYTYGGCDLRPLQGGQLRFSNDIDNFYQLFEDAKIGIENAKADDQIGVAPHSLRAVSPTDLAKIIEFAGSSPIHMHLAEQHAEVEEVQAHLGQRPTEWLLNHADVNSQWCLIHLTHMNPSERLRVAQSGAVAGLCPLTESSLGDGIFDGVNYHDENGRFGLGSDSNIHIALFEELKTLDYSQRLRDHTRAPFADGSHSSGRQIFDQICRSGAQAGARNSGGIAVGHFADLMAVDRENEWLAGRKNDAILDTLIFGGHIQDCISDVWSAGRHQVKNGRHVNHEEISSRYISVIQALKSDL